MTPAAQGDDGLPARPQSTGRGDVTGDGPGRVLGCSAFEQGISTLHAPGVVCNDGADLPQIAGAGTRATARGGQPHMITVKVPRPGSHLIQQSNCRGRGIR